LEVDGTFWIVLEPVPEFHDVVVNGTAGTIAVFITAHLFQEGCACDDAAGILKQKLQSLELLRRQGEWRPVTGHLHFLRVHRDAIKKGSRSDLRAACCDAEPPSGVPGVPSD